MTRDWRLRLALAKSIAVPLLVAAACAMVLTATYLIFDRLIEAASGGQVPSEIAISVRPGESLDIGRRELLQLAGPAAAVERHLRISRTTGGAWRLASPTGQRRALLQFEDGATTFAHRWPLAAGDEVRLQGAILRFLAVDHRARKLDLELRTATGTRRWLLDVSQYNRGVLTPADATPEPSWVGACQQRGLALDVLLGLRHIATGIVDGWRWAERLLRRFQDKPRLALGGVLSCRGGYDVPRLALPGLDARELQLVERGGRFMLAPGPSQPALLIRRGPCRLQGFQDIAWRIDGSSPAVFTAQPDCAVASTIAGTPASRLAAIVLGRTRYEVSITGDRLRLKPTLNVPLLTDADVLALAEERRNAGILAPMPQLVTVPNRSRWIGIPDGLKIVGALNWRAKLTLLLPLVLMAAVLALRHLPAWRIVRGSEQPQVSFSRRTATLILLALSLLLTALSTVFLAVALPVDAGEIGPRAMFALVLVNYGVASLAVALEARTRLSLVVLWVAVLILMATGLLNMAQLGYGADSTRFVELFTGQLLVYGLLPPAVVATTLVRLGLVRLIARPLFTSDRPRAGTGLRHLIAPVDGHAKMSVWRMLRQGLSAMLALIWFAALALLAGLVLALLGAALVNALGAQVMLLDAATSPLQYVGFAVVAALALFLAYRLPLIAFSLQAAPLLLLTLMFLAWLALGGETGLGPFQPVELGKFAAVAFLSLFLIALDRRQGANEPVVPLSLFLVYSGMVIFFILLFAVVPALKSDFSPVLIVTLTSLLLVGVAGARQVARILIGDVASERLQRLRDSRWLAAPNHLPPFRGRLIAVPGLHRRVPLAWVAATFRVTIGLLVLGGGTLLVREVIAPFFWNDYAQARERLETLLAVEDVGKLAERALSYRDLDYDRPLVRDESGRLRRLIDYRDLGLQVIQSRQAIASAPCHRLGDLTGDPRRWLPMRMLLGPEPTTARPPAGRQSGQSPPVTTSAVVAGAATSPMGRLFGAECRALTAPPFGRNPEAVQRIPAVKDDFAAAFFVNRFGLRAALLLGLTQLVLLVVLVAGAFRVRRTHPGDHHETALRFALFGTMLGGAILFALHWGISWSNQFGLLPVMGQPMTFLSLGGSHLTLMAFPLLLVAILGLRFMGEPAARRPHFVPPDPPRRNARAA